MEMVYFVSITNIVRNFLFSMRIPRIFHPDILPIDEAVELTKEASNHLLNVLRLKDGHPLVLFNGDGNEYSAELKHKSKRSAEAIVQTKLGISVESPLNIHLAQGISKGDRMEFVIQKAVELGVTEITPLITERCAVKLNSERWEKKHLQWQKIAISSCEQCGRNVVPTINSPISFSQWIQQSTNQIRLTLDPKAENRLNQIHYLSNGVRLMIGPEGGLSEHEIYQAAEHGYHGVTMGPRILRTETAALSAIAALQSIYGDL